MTPADALAELVAGDPLAYLDTVLPARRPAPVYLLRPPVAQRAA